MSAFGGKGDIGERCVTREVAGHLRYVRLSLNIGLSVLIPEAHTGPHDGHAH